MLYDLTILGLRPNQLGAVMPKLPGALADHIRAGRLLGCFTCELGQLNRIAVLAAYTDQAALQADRALTLGGDIFGLTEHLGSCDRTAFAPLPFMGDIETGAFGPFYEFRTYAIAPGGLHDTAEAWSKVVPRRQEMSKLLTVMGSFEAVPTRMVHIWPYKTLEARGAARAQAVREGIWPPPGGGAHLLSLQAELFMATSFSPLS